MSRNLATANDPNSPPDPGCGVDIPGVLYSLSWFPNPEFTNLFPSQKEILAYIQRVARAYHVPERTRLRTEWKGAKWIESSSSWHVYLTDMQTGEDFIHKAKVLISAVGGYTNPKYPELPGIENFQGPVVHTARWDKDYDLRGRNVAVVGNGCLFNSHNTADRAPQLTDSRLWISTRSCRDGGCQ